MPAAILALAVAQTASAAGPADGGVAARLELRAAASCAERSDVVASVARRSGRIRFVADDRDAVSFRATIRPDAKGDFVAELVVVQSSGRRSSRRFLVGSCAEGVDALAIVIVMTLDPESSALAAEPSADATGAGAGQDQRARSSAGAASNSGAAGSNAARASSTTASGGGPSKSDDASSGVAESAAAPGGDVAPRGEAPHSEILVGASAQLASGPAPSLLLGPALQGTWALERGSLWSPALRLGAGYHWSSETETDRGNADFALALATLDLCPLALRAAGFALRPCALAAAGLLMAKGSKVFDPQSPTRPFALLGGSLLASVDIGSKLQLSGNAGLGGNLVTDTFLFSPNTFYEVPPVTLLFGLGVSYRISVIE